MEILYLPYGGFRTTADRVVAALADSYRIEWVPTFDEIVSIIALQARNQTYSYRACVIGQEMTNEVGQIQRARLECPGIPLIFLTKRKPVAEVRARMLSAGADDCLPIRHLVPDELRATVRRRIIAYDTTRRQLEKDILYVESLRLNRLSQTADIDGRVATFTPTEWLLVEEMALVYPDIVTLERLEYCKQQADLSEDRTLFNVMVCRIRTKLRAISSPVLPKAKYKTGYRFVLIETLQ